MIDTEFDIVVTGGGMVGCTAAALFARLGMTVCLADRRELARWDGRGDHPRVSAVNVASMNLFSHLGIRPVLEQRRACPYREMVVWEDGSDAMISFSAREMGLPELGHIVENDAIVTALCEKLRQNYNVTILENTVLSGKAEHDGGLELSTEDGGLIRCGLLVGADGAQSSVRRISGIDTQFQEFEQDAIVTAVTLERPHRHTAWQSFLTTGPVAMLPLSDGRCSIVWSCDRGFADRAMAMDNREFCESLSGIFQQRLGRVLECGERLRFTLRQHHVTRYIDRRTALVGDAAHITHPLAGLGANIGFLDAAALAEVVADAKEVGRSYAGHPVLRRYERWRKGENALVLETMKGFKLAFGSTVPAVRSARRLGLTLANGIIPLKELFARYAMGVTGDIPSLCKSR